jgi:hypothetical protein
MGKLYDPANIREMTRCGCDAKTTCPPQWVLDLMADRKMSGGFNIKRSNQCPTCFQVRSKNGACGCL